MISSRGLVDRNVTVGRLATTRMFAGVWLGEVSAPRVRGVLSQSLEGKDVLKYRRCKLLLNRHNCYYNL